MDSSGHELERWIPRQGGRTGELAEPVASPENGLSAAKSMGSIDHPLHLPGRADSAYSSFSGGSNIPEYPTPSCCGETCSLPPEQVPYMDSEYVRGICNLSAANLPPYKAPELSIQRNTQSSGLARRCGSSPVQGASKQGPPPSPPTRLDSYKVTRHLESSGGRCSSGSLSEGGVQPPWTQHRDEEMERGLVASCGRALAKKGLSSAPTNEVSKIQGLKVEENGEWNPSQHPIKRSNPHVFSRPSSFIFQEYLKTDSMASIPKMLSAYTSAHSYTAAAERSSKPYQAAHTNPSTVNDTRGDKQCPCSTGKPTSREADLPNVLPEPSQSPKDPKGSSPCPLHLLRAKSLSQGDPKEFEDTCGFRYPENALFIPNASRKLKGWTGVESDAGEPLLNGQATAQPSCSCQEQGNTQGWSSPGHVSPFRPKKESTSRFGHKARTEKQSGKGSPGPGMSLEQEDPPAQPESPEQLQGARAGEEITRQTTPMLYYLSGGKTSSTLYPNKLTPWQEDSRSSPKEFAGSSCPSARCLEMQRGSSWSQRSSAAELAAGSPASSTEESSKEDYREKLKVAQKKVLRETSFKRKDLQMSLPTRLRQKPSKRPSIEHLRSLSLTSASEDAKPLPPSPLQLESLGCFSGVEETKKPQTGRAGGRKRVTKEQKNLCYSEPEKLDQLAGRDVPWSQVRGEISEQGRGKALENRGRALSSSGISRTELKQIQHTALLQYMERKLHQRPGGSQHLPLHKPPLQNRLAQPQWPPGNVSHPNGGRKMQSNDVFPEEKPPEVSPPQVCVPSRCHPSAAGAATSGHHPSQAEGSCPSKCASAESLPQVGAPAAGRARERSKSTPSSTQEERAVAPPGHRGTWLGTPSIQDPEQNGRENDDSKAGDSTGGARCRDAKELTPETSLPIPREGREASAGEEEEERRTASPSGSGWVKHLEQQAVAPGEQGAFPGQGGSARGAAGKDRALLSIPSGTLPGRDARPPGRRPPSTGEQRCEQLALELVAQDSSLGDVLMPQPLRNTALELMEDLFPLHFALLGKPRGEEGDVGHVLEMGDATEGCPEPEQGAKQRSEDLSSEETQLLTQSRGSTNGLDDITAKKLELVGRLRGRLRGLREERQRLQSAARGCCRRGEELQALVGALCQPPEFQRYLLFVGDLEKVVNLLLCLSCRLARVRNALRRSHPDEDAEERHSLNERHELLCRQREDAKDLKENLDRREKVVSGILAKYLTEQQLQDYQHFLQLKTSLLIEQKDLEEQIKYCEEQIENLEKSIPLS